jgi:hypothetical protein
MPSPRGSTQNAFQAREETPEPKVSSYLIWGQSQLLTLFRVVPLLCHQTSGHVLEIF